MIGVYVSRIAYEGAAKLGTALFQIVAETSGGLKSADELLSWLRNMGAPSFNLGLISPPRNPGT
jgi:hypothetical protein